MAAALGSGRRAQAPIEGNVIAARAPASLPGVTIRDSGSVPILGAQASPKMIAIRTSDPNYPVAYVPEPANPLALDSPNPRLSVEPLVPERSPSSRGHVLPFMAVNAVTVGPRISLPPTPLPGAAVLAEPAVVPGTAEYETRFMGGKRTLEQMKKRHDDYQIVVPQYGEPIEKIEAQIVTWRNHIRKDEINCRYQAYLIAGFLIMEALSTKFMKLPAGGLTWSQWVIMSDYEDVLMELAADEIKAVEAAEKEAPMSRLIKMMSFYFVMFVGINYLMKWYPNEKQGSELKDGLWQLMRGNRAFNDPQTGPDLKTNALARLMANTGKILNATGILGESDKKEEKAEVPRPALDDE